MNQHIRVLLVEDDEDDFIVTSRLLKTIYETRVTVDWITTYGPALERLKRYEHDVCLLDYRLGQRNGIELLREIRAENYPAPIILMTGQGDREVDEEAAQAGAADYLIKGQTDAALLERAIRYAILQKQSEGARIELVREREAREQAEEANRAKDSFLTMVTHELRSPLNAILGWVRILRNQSLDEGMTAHALEIIEQSAQTQSNLIEDILDTARITSGKLRLEVSPVILDEVIKAAIEVVRPAAEAKGIELQEIFDGHLNVISGDPNRLQQIIWNLLSNAIKFTPEGGQVKVSLERADPHTRIKVTDTGKGIDPDYMPFIFERFSQDPNNSKGTRRRSGLGLGLSLAKHLVELHGGTIEAFSKGEHKGATFTINLPLRAIRPKDPREKNNNFERKQIASNILNGLHILLVDDEDDARNLITIVLQQFGAKVTAKSSADETLEALQSKESFDVLISDIGMPNRSGYDLMRQIRSMSPENGGHIPAIALTAFGRSLDRIRALSAGFQTHITKPVEPTELALVLGSLTGRVN